MRTKSLILAFIISLTSVFMIKGGLQPACAVEIDYGQKITLNLKNAEITDVFRLIAEQNDLNIVVSPAVKGRISLRLSNVTLQEAIAVILDAADARIEETENIMHVFAKGERDKLDTKKGEMITEIFTVNYANEQTLLSIIEDFLSIEGKARAYRRSRGGNPPMIIVQDFPEKVEAVRKMHERLDNETRQIMIDAKIIETGFQNVDLKGVDWTIGGTFTGSPVAIDTKYGGADGKIEYGTLSFSGFKAVYQRLMEDNSTNVLSDAKLSVLDGENAHIHVGETIPVGLNTISSGAGGAVDYGTTNIQKWEVGVTVDVTPTVIDKNLIRMQIEPEVSSVDDYNDVGSSNGSRAPITSSRYVETEILIRSGETIVIGGLVQDSVATRERKVPLLGELPLIGSVFRKKDVQKRKTNMIIFITGRLIGLKGDMYTQPGDTEHVPASNVSDREALDKFLEYK